MAVGPGDLVGSYRVVRRVGGGASADVFEVEHTTLGSRHALKVLQAQWVDRADLRARFLAEGKLQSGFRHPHLVRVTDTVAEPGVAALVMDLLEGETLRDRLEREGAVGTETAVRWAQECLAGLAEAHRLGVVHRDLKPENLFLERSGTLRVIDFGIAKGADEQRTTRGALGTCAYMSPEQVEDPSAVDARGDLFAVGAVLWEMLTGVPAFEGKSAFASMQAVLSTDPGPPSTRRAVPLWLDAVVARALQKRREDRFPDAAAFASALAAGPDQLTAVPQPPPKRGFSRFWIMGCGAVAGAGTMGLIALVSVAWFLRPATVSPLEISDDSCGEVTVRSEVWARDAPLVLTINGREHHRQQVQGELVFENQSTQVQGTTVDVQLKVGVTTREAQHLVAGRPNYLQFTTTGMMREGAGGRLEVRSGGSCLGDNLRYRGTIGERSIEGEWSAALPFGTEGLKEGAHPVVFEVVRGDEVVLRGEHALVIGEAPPPNDKDLDGYERGSDCNDNDPEVNPGRKELPFANGKDDNCDGRIDEGTTAYDDDGDGVSEDQGDCDDRNREVHPGRREIADCRDQDCDHEIDEGVTLLKSPDTFGKNGTRNSAYDLGTDGDKHFARTLSLIADPSRPDAWFRFYSQDGSWDDWGIDVVAEQLPARGSVHLGVEKIGGGPSDQRPVQHDGEGVFVRGTAFKDDTGNYLLHVRMVGIDPWCPVNLRMVAR